MGKIDTMRADMRRAATAIGGHATIAHRQHTTESFTGWCRDENRQISEPRNKHFRDYIVHRRDVDGVSPGTLKNEAADLRAMCLKLSFTNQELGIPERDRTGTKMPLSDDAHHARVSRIRDEGVRAAAEIQRACGLRNAEVVRIGPHIDSAIRSIERNGTLRVSAGTKGGRLRVAEIHDRPRAIAALKEGRRIVQRDGHLVIGKGGTLKSAQDKFENAMRRAGFTGANAPHSSRYGYAQDLERAYEKEGLNPRQARQLVSESLGHGDGRGRYIASVYGRK